MHVIAKKNRFHGHRAVAHVRGSTIHTQLISVRYAKNNLDDYRLAVVVSKKVAPNAVTRNRIRRRLFELVRTQQRVQGLPIDMVIYCKDPVCADLSSEKLAQEVLDSTKKALRRLYK